MDDTSDSESTKSQIVKPTAQILITLIT